MGVGSAAGRVMAYGTAQRDDLAHRSGDADGPVPWRRRRPGSSRSPRPDGPSVQPHDRGTSLRRPLASTASVGPVVTAEGPAPDVVAEPAQQRRAAASVLASPASSPGKDQHPVPVAPRRRGQQWRGQRPAAGRSGRPARGPARSAAARCPVGQPARGSAASTGSPGGSLPRTRYIACSLRSRRHESLGNAW